MENNFSIVRLQALLYRFWVERKLSLIVLVSVMVFVFSLLNISITNIETYHIPEKIAFLSIFAKLIFLIILLFHLHKAFAKSSGSVNSKFLHLLPASATEKFVYLLMAGFVLPFTLYVAVFELLNIVFVLLKLSCLFSFQQFLFSEITLMGKQGGVEAISIALKHISFLFYYLMFHLLVWGLITFKEYAVLKVFGIVYFSFQIFTFVAFQWFNSIFLLDLMNSLKQYAAESPVSFTMFSWILFVVFFALLSMLFYVNYLKFKRKEIKA